MGSIDSLSGLGFAPVGVRGVGVRAPWRRGAAWTPSEAAVVLQARRGELVRELARRREAVGVPAGVREEIVDEAICAVVMMRRPLVSERHLLGAFWVMVRALVGRYREGRRDLRLGSRRRVSFDEVELEAEGLAAEEIVELADSAWRAADLMAALSEVEARVVLVTATRGIGAKAAARELGLAVKDARAAARSARGKLEMVAAVAAAGRMCAYREGAVVAHARGEALGERARVARAHLRACASCRMEYRQLRREMGGRDWQRSAAAVFLPGLAAGGGGHGGWFERVAGWLSVRHFAPRGMGERTAEAAGAAGGVGVVKATATGTAIIAATATVAGSLHALVIPATHHAAHRHPHPLSAVSVAPVAAAASQPVASPPTPTPTSSTATAPQPSAQVLAARRRAQAEARASPAEREFGPEGEASTSDGGPAPASSEAQASTPAAHAASVPPAAPVESSVGSPAGSSSVSESSGSRQSAGESQAEREFGP